MLQDIFQRIIFENTIENYCWFFAIILAGILLKRFLSRILSQFVFNFLRKYSSGIAFEKLWALLRKPVEILILLIALYAAFSRLEVPSSWNLSPINTFGIRMFFYRSFQAGSILSFTWILLRMVDFFGLVLVNRAEQTEHKTDDQLIPFIKEAIKIIVIIFSIFFILGTVFKLNIASLIAGLGIGGLAVALAAKESLENLLGSFTIFLDKPFVIGDLIKVGGIEGTVEKIGFRSTRIRTVDKTFLTVPNKKMVEAELDNLTLRTQRRAKFFVNLIYSCAPDQLEKIITEIQKCIDMHPKINKQESRVRLYDVEKSCLSIMVLYFVNSSDYDDYINTRQEINYKIIETVKKHEADFATPITNVIVAK